MILTCRRCGGPVRSILFAFGDVKVRNEPCGCIDAGVKATMTVATGGEA